MSNVCGIIRRNISTDDAANAGREPFDFQINEALRLCEHMIELGQLVEETVEQISAMSRVANRDFCSRCRVIIHQTDVDSDGAAQVEEFDIDEILDESFEPDFTPIVSVEKNTTKIKPNRHRRQMIDSLFKLYTQLYELEIIKSDYSKVHFETMNKKELFKTHLRYSMKRKIYLKEHIVP
ncbi:MAG: hypothetical protein ACD_58C00118G0003 [uncultured bacterium]|nr:MAG: hypothetical protein ACD_58C00118G0003 [uncultured bacterium]